MIQCGDCHRSMMTTKHEVLDSCPECDPEHWTVYRLSNGAKTTGMIAKALERSKTRMVGQCFLTPKGTIVMLAQWRHYEKAKPKVMKAGAE